MINKGKSYLKKLIRLNSGLKVSQPIVIFESDDWGMWRSPRGGKIDDLGVPKYWAHDTLENEQELDQLFSLLKSFTGAFPRTPFFTANMIVSNPDFQKTVGSGFSKIHLRTLDEQFPQQVLKYSEGFRKEVFFPQYHGRFHFSFSKYLSMLQKDELSREIFKRHYHGGINNLEGSDWTLHSEYIAWDDGMQMLNLIDWLKEGIVAFERIFGYKPKSHIAPQYIFHPEQADAFIQNGMIVFQGCNMQMYKQQGKFKSINLSTGSKFYKGAVAMGRNVKFEPTRGIDELKAEAVHKKIDKIHQRKEIAVIDTHRINYVGAFADEGLSELGKLLTALKDKQVLFLSSVELAECLDSAAYKNVFSQSVSELEIQDNGFKRFFRNHNY